MFKLIHSFQYLNLDNKFKIINNYIVDEYNNKILGLNNIPTDTSLYSININKLLLKKKSNRTNLINNELNIIDETNICINIEVDYNKLVEAIYSMSIIPDHKLFFYLLRKNYNRNIICDLSLNKLNIISNINNLSPIIFSKNIIKIQDIYIDIELERFYLSLEEFNPQIMGNIIVSNPCGKIRDTFINSGNKICVITQDINNIKWMKSNYILINKNNFYKINYKELQIANIIIIDQNLFTSKKYINEWTNYMNNGQSLKESYRTLELYFNRNNNIKTNLMFHLLKYDILILDSCLIQKEIINCFKFTYIYYITEKYNIIYDDIQIILDSLFDLKINKLNSNYIRDGIYFERPQNNNLKLINANIKIKNTYNLDMVKINEKILFNSLELNVYPYRIKINKKIGIVECPICLETNDNIGGLNNCNHLFCLDCIMKLKSSTCPLCRGEYNYVYKILKSHKQLSTRLLYISTIKNGLIISKYEKSIENLANFYDDLNIINNVVDKDFLKNHQKYKQGNYLMTYNNYNILNNKKLCFKKVYLLEYLTDTDIFFKNILQSINAKNIVVINN